MRSKRTVRGGEVLAEVSGRGHIASTPRGGRCLGDGRLEGRKFKTPVKLCARFAPAGRNLCPIVCVTICCVTSWIFGYCVVDSSLGLVVVFILRDGSKPSATVQKSVRDE